MPDSTTPLPLSDAERLALIKQERARMEAARQKSAYNPDSKPYISWYTEAARIQRELEQIEPLPKK